nr:MAG TPA: hypothetical protein [Caudoviricetes sp.]
MTNLETVKKRISEDFKSIKVIGVSEETADYYRQQAKCYQHTSQIVFAVNINYRASTLVVTFRSGAVTKAALIQSDGAAYNYDNGEYYVNSKTCMFLNLTVESFNKFKYLIECLKNSEIKYDLIKWLGGDLHTLKSHN